ncbi:hypothetical protein KIW84_033928 [Lathyrus oleraceus]|uniref:Uncharacterized protein n=1 Tax=Pisum sativum TaxID=3888 RepID=A0A9D4XYY6_PEA|nr:hypothetical protein KIW84_033928 [Pisum sativum]
MKNFGSQKERNEMVKYCVRPTKTNKIRLRIHHRGRLVETPVKWYCLCYLNPAYNFSRGLRPLNNDQDVLQFSKDVVGYDVIDVYVEHSVGIPGIIDDNEVDAEDDVQCTGFKSLDVTEEVTIDPNGVAEEVTIDPSIVVEEVTTDPNVVVEEFTTDVNNETGQEDINDDYVVSEGSFEDNEFQFSEDFEESEMDWTNVLPQETLGEISSCQNKKDQAEMAHDESED